MCRSLDLRFRLYVVAQYIPPLTNAILHIKYRPNQPLADEMAGWLAQVYRRQRVAADLIIPVPLSAMRYRQRGYNQVELVAQSLSRILGIPCRPQLLKRQRDTGSQVGLNAEQREINVRDAFQAPIPIESQLKILLVDDLVTTGSTVFACSQALARAGATDITVIAIGKAEERFHR